MTGRGALRRLDDTGLPLLLARLAVGATFLTLGWAKFSDPVAFLKALREYCERDTWGMVVLGRFLSR